MNATLTEKALNDLKWDYEILEQKFSKVKKKIQLHSFLLLRCYIHVQHGYGPNTCALVVDVNVLACVCVPAHHPASAGKGRVVQITR